MFALFDGHVHPTGKSVMYPILHVFRLTLSQSRIHTFTHGGTVAFYVQAYPRSPVTGRFKATMHPVPDAHLND